MELSSDQRDRELRQFHNLGLGSYPPHKASFKMCKNIYFCIYMGVFKNSGVSPQIIHLFIGFGTIINHPFWGTTIFGNIHIYIYIYLAVTQSSFTFSESNFNFEKKVLEKIIDSSNVVVISGKLVDEIG